MTLFLAGSATIGSAANDTMPLHSGLEVQTGEPKRMASGDGAGRGAHRPAGQRTDRRSLLPAQRTLPAVDRQGRLDLRSLLRRRNADARLRTRPAGVPRSGHLCRRLPERNPDPDGGQHVPPLGRRSQTPAQGARQRTARLFPLPDQQGPAASTNPCPTVTRLGTIKAGQPGGLDGKKRQPLHPQGRLSVTAGTGVRGWLRRASGVR